MAYEWIGTAAAGLASTAGSIIAANQNNAASWDQLKAQHDFQREMFDKTNQYNTPQEQVSRLRAAGINPFLVGSDGLMSSGQGVMPSSPGSPSFGHLPDFTPLSNGVSAAMQMRQQQAVLDANAGNQRAQMLGLLVDNFSKVAKSMGLDSAKKYLDDFAPFFIGADWQNSPDKRALDAQIGKLEAEESLSKVQASIAEKWGEKRAEQEMANMSMEFAKINANIGLWRSMADLNDAKVKLTDAEIKALPSRIAMQFASAASSGALAKLLGEKAITEQEMRDWYVGQLELEFYSKGFNVGEQSAEWSANEAVRKQKGTSYEKARRAFNYMWDSSPAMKVLHEAERAVQSVPIKIPFAPNTPPTMIHTRTGSTPSGNWYDSYDMYQYQYP